MRSAYEIYLNRRDRNMRLLGHASTAVIAVMITLILVTACSKMDQVNHYKASENLTRAQEGYTDAIKEQQHNIGNLGGQQ